MDFSLSHLKKVTRGFSCLGFRMSAGRLGSCALMPSLDTWLEFSNHFSLIQTMAPGNKLIAARNTQPSFCAMTAEDMAWAKALNQALSTPVYGIECIKKKSRIILQQAASQRMSWCNFFYIKGTGFLCLESCTLSCCGKRWHQTYWKAVSANHPWNVSEKCHVMLMSFTEVVPDTVLSSGLWKHRDDCIWGEIWEKYGLSVPEQRCKDRERSAVC